MSDNIPSFTVLITTYNRLELLDRAINSALSQTLPCEVVVVDDCSIDETESYMKRRVETWSPQENCRLVYHRNPSNQGHSKSVNVGVEIARGDWIKFLDDDDYLAADCLETIARAIVRCPNAVICSVRTANVDLDGQEQSYTQTIGPKPAFYIPQEDIHYGMLIEQVPFGTPVQVAVKREAFLRSGGWKSSFDVNFDDIESWANIAQFGDAIFIQKCLAYRTTWQGAYNYRLPFQKRLETHILIKTKIYELVSAPHRHKLPKLVSVNAYLQLYWGLIALKGKRPFEAIGLLFPALFSPTAWRLLQDVLAFRRDPNTDTKIRKIPLTDF
ncbi:MAG: glycosyltransferase family 2 protein [Limnospira sp.]